MYKEEKTGCIYKITCIPNGRFYIGLTIRDPTIRWNSHKNNPNKKLKPDIDEYGWDSFKKEILFDNIIESDLAALEIDTITKFKPYYNISLGGSMGSGLSGENLPHKLSNKEVENIRINYYHHNIHQNILATKYKVSDSLINGIVLGKQRKNEDGPISTKKILKGEEHPNHILLDTEIVEIRFKYANSNISQINLAIMYGVTAAAISDIVLGKSRKSSGGIISKSKGQLGENNPNCKYTDKQIQEIRKEYATGKYTQKYLAKKYETTQQRIGLWILGKSRGSAGGPIKGVDY